MVISIRQNKPIDEFNQRKGLFGDRFDEMTLICTNNSGLLDINRALLVTTEVFFDDFTFGIKSNLEIVLQLGVGHFTENRFVNAESQR